MGNLVEVEGLSKRYERKTALEGVSFSIPEGKIIGLLGPNGAGKTTLIKILTGLISDYKGDVLIDGQEPGAHSKEIISFLPDKTYLSSWMKVSDTVDLFADFYKDFDRKKANELLDRLNIDAGQKVTRLSKGTYEKVQLVLVMSREARLYILDEPIGGVDPASRDVILDTIISNYNEKSSVLLSTQLIQDVERIFDSIIILQEGRIIIHDEVDAVRAKHGKSIDELFREVFKCC
ncbi:MAG TPA: ABC transporter ATP-binding protein [Clostridia bacterium]|nr:ABC transporter ATP-binding protein [Clostridia bacterium]